MTASPTTVSELLTLGIHVSIAAEVVGSIVVSVPLIKPAFVVVFTLVCTIVVVVDLVCHAFPCTICKLFTFVVPIAVGIFRDSIAINVPFSVPAIERTEAVIRVSTVVVGEGPNISFIFATSTVFFSIVDPIHWNGVSVIACELIIMMVIMVITVVSVVMVVVVITVISMVMVVVQGDLGLENV